MRRFVVLFTLLLASCTNPSDPRNSLAGGMLATIDKLEASGQLPKLDRSDSLLGPDVDHDGIRDDIDKYIEVIAAEKKYTRQQTMAMRQVARDFQHILAIDISDKKQLAAASNEEARVISCLFFRFNGEDVENVSDFIQSVTYNTKQRVVAYANYNSALSGSVTSLPPDDATSCDE